MAIADNKTDKSPPPIKKPDFKLFAVSLLWVLLYTLFFIIIGNVALYTTKIAKVGVLPTDINKLFNKSSGLIGGSNDDTPIDKLPMNYYKKYGWHGFKWFAKPVEEQQYMGIFNIPEILNSFKDEKSILGYLYKKKEKTESFIILYFINVIFTAIEYGNNAINVIFKTLGNYCPEFIMLLVFPMLYSYFYGVITICFYAIAFVSHVVNVADLFRVKENGKWEEKVKYFRIFRIIILIVFCFMGLFMSVTGISIFVAIFCIITPLMIPFKYSNNMANIINFFSTKNISFLINNILCNTQLYMFIFTYFILDKTNIYLGNMYLGAGGLLAFILIFYDFYNNNKPNM